MAETIERELDLFRDIEKFKILFGYDLIEVHKLTFMTYQSAYKMIGQGFDFVCADEIHDSLSPSYSKFYFNNKYKYILGLTATEKSNVWYQHEDNTSMFTKLDLLNRIAPICYTYNLEDGQIDGTSRRLKINMIIGRLNQEKNIQVKLNSLNFLTSEAASYKYWDDKYQSTTSIEDPVGRNKAIKWSSSNRAKLLYKLHSKNESCKKLINQLEGKTILFANDIDSLLSITPDVVSSRNSKNKNIEIRRKFDADEINLIGSFKKLKQGANLTRIDNVILLSYYGIEKDFIQRVGRARQSSDGSLANIYIFVTENTQEEVWARKMLESFPSVEINKVYSC